MQEIEKYYSSLYQDIRSMQDSSDEGDSQEQLFTQMAIDILSDGGETENARIAYDDKAFGTKNQHKINGYALSDNYETVDLFITIYNGSETIQRITKEKVDQAAIRISNFFIKAIYNDYVNEIEESSPIFEFSDTLANYKELKDNLVRVNAVIITNGEYKGDFPPTREICGYKVFYRVLDINYLYGISEASRMPIEISFEEDNIQVPCVTAETGSEEYQAYIAIMPGQGLVNLYERFGSRLLEQNVRSFLQFTGKINKGIRNTILNEPYMFLAFNNGIAATADEIELDDTGHFIKRISNLQIVNGGQTTASIYHTWKKDKADISNIHVQLKLSVIKNKDEFSNIVSQISRYANTQNKVNDADFTANNPFLIDFEKLSRYILSPTTEQNNIQTNWFFERARGQYKNIRQKDGFTKSRQKQFDLKYPKFQMFTKVELAKYLNAYQEVWDGRKLVIGPHIVVRGNEKNYAQFINNNIPQKFNNVYFEDAIAKIILFKKAEKLYGVKPNNIGEMRSAVVPYAISLLGYLTSNKLDLYKIWKTQTISTQLSDFLYDLMGKINQFIIDNSPSSHYIEWAKKEECWTMVKESEWAVNIAVIKSDMLDSSHSSKRQVIISADDDKEQYKYEIELLKSIPFKLWREIETWGKESGFLSIIQQSLTYDISNKIKNGRSLDEVRQRGMIIFEIVCKENLELLNHADELQDDLSSITGMPNLTTMEITMDIVRQMTDWDKRKRVLDDWKWNTMKGIIDGKFPLEGKYLFACQKNLETLKKRGFSLFDTE